MLFPWEKTPYAHELMRTNRHKPGNMAVLVNTPRQGLRNFDDVLEAQRSNAEIGHPVLDCFAPARFARNDKKRARMSGPSTTSALRSWFAPGQAAP